MPKLSRLAALIGAAALSAAAFAGDISVVDPYVRLVPQGTPTTAAFMTVKNAGNANRKLVKADSAVAKTVELHNHINDNGVMKMRPVKEIEVKAKGQAELKPGSYHVMLIDLKQALKEGEKVSLTLSFDDGSTEKVEAVVKNPMAQMQHGHSH